MRSFFNELGRFPGSLKFATVPQGEVPNFINTSYIISPGDLYDLEHQTQENLSRYENPPVYVSWR